MYLFAFFLLISGAINMINAANTTANVMGVVLAVAYITLWVIAVMFLVNLMPQWWDSLVTFVNTSTKKSESVKTEPINTTNTDNSND